jgi:hypothetical protein
MMAGVELKVGSRLKWNHFAMKVQVTTGIAGYPAAAVPLRVQSMRSVLLRKNDVPKKDMSRAGKDMHRDFQSSPMVLILRYTVRTRKRT